MGEENRVDNKKISDILNVNVNNKYISNVNDNVKKYTTSYEKSRSVESIAYELANKFNDRDTSFNFYCKVAHNLPESRIWSNAEIALESGKNPAKLFSWLCSRDMRNQ